MDTSINRVADEPSKGVKEAGISSEKAARALQRLGSALSGRQKERADKYAEERKAMYNHRARLWGEDYAANQEAKRQRNIDRKLDDEITAHTKIRPIGSKPSMRFHK